MHVILRCLAAITRDDANAPCSFATAVVAQAGDAMKARLLTYLQQEITFKSKLGARSASGGRPLAREQLRHLMRNMCGALPADSIAELLQDLEVALDDESDEQAVVAADIIALMMPHGADLGHEVTLLQLLLSAAQNNAAPLLRLKAVNLMPGVAAECSKEKDQRRCRAAIEVRLLDAEASVRTAAARALGEAAAAAPPAEARRPLEKLLERLRDVSEAVRLAVRIRATSPGHVVNCLLASTFARCVAAVVHSDAACFQAVHSALTSRACIKYNHGGKFCV